jgi:hypothetical protein
MAIRSGSALFWLVLAITGIAGAYLAGLRQGQNAATRMLQIEAAGNLTQRIEALSLLRLGETSAAIADLEQQADQLTLGIAANEGAEKRVLLAAKAYRSLAPPPPSRSSELEAVFDTLPTPKPSDCGSALQRLLKSRKTSAGQQ